MTNGNDDAFASVAVRSDGDLVGECGLTKREYFAAQALNIWQMEEVDLDRLERGDTPNHQIVARFCVEVADALIAELNK